MTYEFGHSDVWLLVWLADAVDRRQPLGVDDSVRWTRSRFSVFFVLCLLGCGRIEAGDEGLTTGEASTAEPAQGSEAQGDERQVGGNTRFKSFRTAKKRLKEVYADRRETFYCGCAFSPDKAVDWESCGYRPRKNAKRAGKMEVEHVVAAEAFGHAFVSWREGHPDCVKKKGKDKGKRYKGRKCARKVSELFQRMASDLHNLQPSVGEVNGDRKNYSMQEIPGEAREYGACDVEISGRKIEPRESIRGDIARIYFYMDQAYPGRGIVGRKRKRILEAWDKADPVDDWERTRNQRIARIQGNANPFVE